MKYPVVVETRLTYDHGGKMGMNCDYPLGLFNTLTHQGQRFEIDRGQWPIAVELGFRSHGWALITDVSGQPMTKIRVPERVELDFTEYRFYSYGKLFVLIRSLTMKSKRNYPITTTNVVG
jgi:hypothetical protein